MKLKYLIIPLLLYFLTVPGIIKCQDYTNLVRKEKYAKALRKCEKKLKKEPESIELLYFSAMVKCKERAGNSCDPEDAYRRYLKVQDLFQKVTDTKRIEKLAKIPINEPSLFLLADSIYTTAYRLALKKNTEESFIQFLEVYQEAFQSFKLNAISKRNKIAFDAARAGNTEESYQVFLTKYPDAMEKYDAIKYRNECAFLTASKENTLAAYQSFIEKYPGAVQINEATQLRNACAFRKAKEENTISSFQNFIDAFPNAKEIPEAIQNRNQIAFSDALKINSIESFNNFISIYPEAKEVPEAKENIYKIAFHETELVHTKAAYEDFINQYPASGQATTARKKIHAIAFTETKSINNSAAYDDYLNNYPDSEFATEAKQLFFEKEFEENTIPEAWETYRDFFENYTGPFQQSALDSIVSLSRNGNLSAMNYLIENGHNTDNISGIIEGAFDAISARGDLSEIKGFLQKFESYLSEEKTVSANEKLSWANFAESLKLEEPYKAANKDLYRQYIQYSGDNDLSFVALNRLISKEINEKKYSEAIKIIESLQAYFIRNKDKVNTLKEILLAKTDPKIKLEPIAEVNTTGNEYSPVISADDRTLFFCGKDRAGEEKNERIFSSSRSSGKWNRPFHINLNTELIENTAPLAQSADGNNIYVFSDGDIYQSTKTPEGWSSPEVLDEKINSDMWEGDLTIASNNKTMIFSRGNPQMEKNIDIVFLVDASGSMESCISGVRENIYNFIDGLKDGDASVNWRAKIVYYRDFEVDGAYAYEAMGFTSDIETLRSQLEYPAAGGGDEPESTIESINLVARETDWRSTKNSSRVIISFTDATNKDWISASSRRKYGNVSPETVLSSIRKAGIRLFLFGKYDPDYYKLGSDLSEIVLFENAVYELQNADYSSIMNDLSQKVSLISSNTRVFHGDRLPVSDLYISHKNDSGSWDPPIRLPKTINTPYTERSPFLHPDMKTLYFSSDGHGGLGKLDVFMSTRLADSCWDCWSAPVNLGKEINSINSDWGYKISTDGQVAYFSKDSRTKNREDIYKIPLPAHLRPDFVARVEGELKNAQNKPIATTIHWEDLESNKVIGSARSDPKDGSYFIVLPMGKNYGYFIEDSTFFPFAQNLDLRKTSSAVEVKKDIKVISFQEMIEEGTPVPMNNLFFEFSKYNLLHESVPELKRVASIIKKYNLKVSIDGHTDNVGDDRTNQTLSEKRANSVREFLIREGCSPALLSASGFGKSRPVDNNDNDAGRARNRRVEVKFVK